MRRHWLINGKSRFIRKARTARKAKNRRATMARKHRNSPRRGPGGKFLKRSSSTSKLGNRKRGRRRGGMFTKLFNSRRHRNPAPPSLEGLAVSVVSGTVGYLATKGVGKLTDRYMPEHFFIERPIYRELLGTGVSAFLAVWAAQTILADKPRISAAVTVGALMPVGELAIRMSPLGPHLGMFEPGCDMMLPTDPGYMLPAPGGINASLNAKLEAALESDRAGVDWTTG
jgi:hypothetical protein